MTSELAQINTYAVEFLDAMITGIHHKDVVGIVNSQISGAVELPVSGAAGSELPLINARAVEFLNAVIFSIRHKDIAGTINRNALGGIELPIAAAIFASENLNRHIFRRYRVLWQHHFRNCDDDKKKNSLQPKSSYIGTQNNF
jgi:hypothetical protein